MDDDRSDLMKEVLRLRLSGVSDAENEALAKLMTPAREQLAAWRNIRARTMASVANDA